MKSAICAVIRRPHSLVSTDRVRETCRYRASITAVYAGLALFGVLLTTVAARAESPLGNARQLLVVSTASWTATTGSLQRYDRRADGSWNRVDLPIPVVIGRSGLGWGFGLQSDSRPGPAKREGDGRSPAGAFTIGAAFGYDSDKPDWLKLPYFPLTAATECVDDANSKYYNSVVDRVPTQPAGWNSSEKMRQIPEYRWGIMVNQNAHRTPGGGSCIFIHIWDGPSSTTAGCTAMQQSDLEEVLRWLDASAKPVLIVLPVSEYERVRRSWRLPSQATH